jgi:hypothetical protein
MTGHALVIEVTDRHDFVPETEVGYFSEARVNGQRATRDAEPTA